MREALLAQFREVKVQTVTTYVVVFRQILLYYIDLQDCSRNFKKSFLD